jgi:hypothetical protein
VGARPRAGGRRGRDRARGARHGRGPAPGHVAGGEQKRRRKRTCGESPRGSGGGAGTRRTQGSEAGPSGGSAKGGSELEEKPDSAGYANFVAKTKLACEVARSAPAPAAPRRPIKCRNSYSNKALESPHKSQERAAKKGPPVNSRAPRARFGAIRPSFFDQVPASSWQVVRSPAGAEVERPHGSGAGEIVTAKSVPCVSMP